MPQFSVLFTLVASWPTYVAVAANISVMPARVVAISARENSTVKMAIVQRRFAMLAIVYNRIVEAIGNTHARIVVITQVRRRIVDLS